MTEKTAGYFSYWGKALASSADVQSSHVVPCWHPLVYHSLDVAACGYQLLTMRPSYLRKLSVSSNLPTEIVLQWLSFLMSLHDIGKFSNGFQQKRPDIQKQLRGIRTNSGGEQRHDALGYVLADSYLLSWLKQEEESEKILLRPWLAAVMGHHGKPPRYESHSEKKRVIRNHFPSTVISDTQRFVQDTACLFHQHTFPHLYSENQEEGYQRTSWLLAGIVVVADWLGSNTYWFPYTAPVHTIEDYWKTVALPHAQVAVAESGLVSPTISPFQTISALFPGIHNTTPLQQWAEHTPIDDGPQLFICEELTGAGKTEAALTLAARLMEKGQGEGVYFALPTMSTADAMYHRIMKEDEKGRPCWKRFFSEGTPQCILAHSASHIPFRLEEKNHRDAGYAIGEECSASRHCSGWVADHRKKALLADFGIGTLDQALLSILPVRHQSLRLLGLAGKILIVDEVHACDAYMSELLSRLLMFHAALGGSAILLSATLPHKQRTDYTKAFANGSKFPAPTPVLHDYPLTSQYSASRWEERPHDARQECVRSVRVDILGNEEEVFIRLKEILEKGGNVVWIRNTVADAVETWERWKKSSPYPAILFHARFALKDRLTINEEIHRAFGPTSQPEDRRRKLVIATQVIEQSLDVDFDHMVTDLAPIDSVIQRAGRLQRHRRDKDGMLLKETQIKDEREEPCLTVLMPDPVTDASETWITSFLPRTGKVYPDHATLWLTADWLKRHRSFSLPSQIRDMIEWVYDDDQKIQRIPVKLHINYQKAYGKHQSDKSCGRANAFVLSSGYDYYNPNGMEWEEDMYTPTRLSEIDMVRVRLAKRVGNVLMSWVGKDTDTDWYLSEVNIPSPLIKEEYPDQKTDIESLREKMTDNGRYVKIVILEESGDGNRQVWQGYAINKASQITRLFYSPEVGVTMHQVETDEFDQ